MSIFVDRRFARDDVGLEQTCGRMSVDSCSDINLRIGGFFTQHSQAHVGESSWRGGHSGQGFEMTAESSRCRDADLILNEPSSEHVQGLYRPVPLEVHQPPPSHEYPTVPSPKPQRAATPSILCSSSPIYS